MPSFWLEYVQNGQRREFSFDAQSVSIGRDKGSDFVLDHPTVSRQHALIVSNQHGHQLVVLSRGGLTAIDGSQVSGEIDLYDGSQIHFGQLAFTFRSQNAPRRPADGGAHQHQQSGWGQQAGAQGSSAQWDQPQQQPGGWTQQQQSDGWSEPQQGQGAHQSAGWEQPRQSGAHQAPRQSGAWEQPGAQQQGAGRQSGQYGAPPSGTYSQPRNSGSFEQAPNSGTLNQPNSGAFEGGGWESQVGQAGDDWGNTAAEDAGLMSWDEIAASADSEAEVEVDAASAALSDFEKIKRAQEKAEEQSKGNPKLIIVGLIAIAGLMVFIMLPTGGGGGGDEPDEIQVANDPPKIDWKKNDIDCVGKANCEAEALQAYRVGKDICEQLDSAVGNRYECYMQMTKAEALLANGGIESPPEEMKGYTEVRDKMAQGLKKRFQLLRANIHSDKKLKMWGNVAEKLRQVKATFPDKRCNYHQWALEKERIMKEEGIYPTQNFQP